MRRVSTPSSMVGVGVAEHGEVHEVGLGLLLEALPIRPLDGGEPPGPDGIGPGPEAFHHGLRVELVGHVPMVPAVPVRHDWGHLALHWLHW